MLTKIPIDIFRSYIFPLLDGQSLINLSVVSRHFYYLINKDEFIWRRLCVDEFNISFDTAFRNSGWKKFYEALKFHTQVYVWGENSDSRLGLPAVNSEPGYSSQMFRPIFRGRPFRRRGNPTAALVPTELTQLNEKAIVDITVGGWSFHALDAYGSVWTWGYFHKELFREHSIGTRFLDEPTLLQTENEAVPKIAFKSISSGRTHVIGLARDGSVWHWTNHIVIQKVELNADAKIVQVVANWSYSSVLTEEGFIYVIPMPDHIPPSQSQVAPPPTEVVTEGVKASDFGFSDDKIVQLAGLDQYTIALTRYGRVLKVSTGNVNTLSNMRSFSVTELKKFSSSQDELNDRHHVMKRFITGSYLNFAVYTADQVMIGNVDATEYTMPEIIPELENQDICKVSFGDYHCGALTNQGKVLTWGSFSSGALGQGNVNEYGEHRPSFVEGLDDKFVFTIGFGGWQSSALAVDKEFTSE